MSQSPQVLEWTGSLACGYAGKLLAEAGIKVVRVCEVTHPQPEPSRNPWFDAFLNSAKSIVVLSADQDERRSQVARLIGQSTVLLTGDDLPPDVGRELSTMATGITTVSITPFGVDGPYAEYAAGDLELSAFAGLSYLTPRDIVRVGNGRSQPPLKMPGALPSIYAGTAGASACLTALLQPNLFRGQHIDVASVETLIPTLRRELALFQYSAVTASRFMRVWQLAPWGIKRCKDGFVFVQVVETHHWRGLVEMMGSPTWASDERYCDPDYRFEHRHHIEEQMAPWLLEITKTWFSWECQKRGLPFAPVNTVADVVRIPQLHFRSFFSSALSEHTGPCTVPRLPYLIRTAPTTSQAKAQSSSCAEDPRKPLAGIRVADFGHVWAGPYCTQVLADLGAEVIKIESTRRLDIHRRQGPYPNGKPDINSSGVWNSQNRGKASVTIDLSTSDGRDLAREFVAHCDVVVENFAPDVMRKLGLDYNALAAVNPQIVMLSLSAFGQDGPQKDNVGYGPSLDAWSGLDSQTAYDADHPGPLGGVFPDTGSALHGVVAILHGLFERQRSGRGRYIDVSELEVSALLIADLLCEHLGSGTNSIGPGNVHLEYFPYGVFPCAGDDAWVAITITNTDDWSKLCRLLGRASWADDPLFLTPEKRRQHQQVIEDAIAEWTLERSPQSCTNTLQSLGIRAAPVNKVPDMLDDAHLAARGYFQNVNHPVAGPLRIYGSLWKVRGMERHDLQAAPVLGESTDRVLRLVLGLPDDKIHDLRTRKIAY